MRAVEAALQIPEGARADAAFALQCVDAVIDAERDADTPERATISAPHARAGAGGRCRARLVLGIEIAQTLEEATDRLAHAAMSLAQSHLAGAVGMSDTHFDPVFIGPGGSPAPILAADVGSKAAELARLARAAFAGPASLRPSDRAFAPAWSPATTRR